MITGQRAREVGQHPARAEYDGLVLVHVVQQEAALTEPGDRALHNLFVKVARRGALEALHYAGLVALGLEAPDEPCPRVGQALVVEVDGILRCEHEAYAVSARLLQQGQEQFLRRRVRDRRHVAEDLVHVENRAQR